MKIKDLTIAKIIEIAKKYRKNRGKCPLVDIYELPCYDFCELKETKQIEIEKSFEEEIEVLGECEQAKMKIY